MRVVFLEDVDGVVSPYSLTGIRVDSAVSETFNYLVAVLVEFK